MFFDKVEFIESGKYDVVILDDLHHKLFKVLTHNKKCITIPIRNKIPLIFNLFFFIKLFLFFCLNKFSFKKLRENYLIFLFSYIKTKKVFTFYENTIRISNLKKKFPEIKFYTFINGTRVPNYKYKHDNYISWGKIDEEMDNSNKKYLSNRYYDLGSLRLLNYYQYKKKYKKNIDILYVSGFSTILKKQNKNIFSIFNVIKNNELLVLKNLSALKKKYNLKIKILMKNEISSVDFDKELSYFKIFFNVNEILFKKKSTDSYKLIEKSKITLSLVSALGLEALSLNTKVLLGFSMLKKKKELKFWNSLNFYCKYLNPEICMTNITNKSLYKKIRNLDQMKYQHYLNLTKRSRKYYSNVPDLKKFKRVIYEN